MFKDDPSALHVGRLTRMLDHALTRRCLKIARERVKLMEKKGYITRQSAAGDTRLKKLSLTPLGISVFERSMEAIEEVEALAVQGLSLEERQLFQDLCQRIQANLRT